MVNKIAILISGQIRNNSLGKGTNTQFVDTFNQYFLNTDLTENYEINIFLAVDKALPEKIYSYFGNYLKSHIFLDENDIKEPINLEESIDNYISFYKLRRSQKEKFPLETPPRQEQVYALYKRYCAYYLMKEYEELMTFQHDFIIWVRPDCFFTHSVYPYIQQLEYKTHFLNQNDYAYIGRYDIMCHYLKTIFEYGKYMYNEVIHPDNIIDTLCRTPYKYRYLAEMLWPCWVESPEVQIFEHIIKYYNINQLLPDNLGSIYNFSHFVENRKESVYW
jgi:hypothetical protein